MAITKTFYAIPEADVRTDEQIVDFIKNTLAPFFAEKLGLVVRDDLEVTNPSYQSGNACKFVTFLGPSTTVAPYLAIYNAPNTSDIFKGYNIAPVREVFGEYMPRTVRTSTPGGQAGIDFGDSNILINVNYAYDNKLGVFDFGDGRKLGVLRSYVKNSQAEARPDWWSSIYLGPLKVDSNITDGCVVFSNYSFHSYIEEYEIQPSDTNMQYLPYITNNGQSGFFYNSSDGKDYLLKMDIAINSRVYIPNMCMFSDVLNRANAGTVITIDENKYVCVANRSSGYSRILIPEEVN